VKGTTINVGKQGGQVAAGNNAGADMHKSGNGQGAEDRKSVKRKKTRK